MNQRIPLTVLAVVLAAGCLDDLRLPKTRLGGATGPAFQTGSRQHAGVALEIELRAVGTSGWGVCASGLGMFYGGAAPSATLLGSLGQTDLYTVGVAYERSRASFCGGLGLNSTTDDPRWGAHAMLQGRYAIVVGSAWSVDLVLDTALTNSFKNSRREAILAPVIGFTWRPDE